MFQLRRLAGISTDFHPMIVTNDHYSAFVMVDGVRVVNHGGYVGECFKLRIGHPLCNFKRKALCDEENVETFAPAVPIMEAV